MPAAWTLVTERPERAAVLRSSFDVARRAHFTCLKRPPPEKVRAREKNEPDLSHAVLKRRSWRCIGSHESWLRSRRILKATESTSDGYELAARAQLRRSLLLVVRHEAGSREPQ